MRTTRALAADSVLAAADFAPAACETSAVHAAFRYDPRTQVVRTVRDLRLDEIVADVPAFALAGVRPGQKLYIRTKVGPVVIQREVEAVQPARKGQPLFVRAADGAVFSVPFPEDVR